MTILTLFHRWYICDFWSILNLQLLRIKGFYFCLLENSECPLETLILHRRLYWLQTAATAWQVHSNLAIDAHQFAVLGLLFSFAVLGFFSVKYNYDRKMHLEYLLDDLSKLLLYLLIWPQLESVVCKSEYIYTATKIEIQCWTLPSSTKVCIHTEYMMLSSLDKSLRRMPRT